MTILDSIASKLTKRKQSAEAEYFTLAKEIANGREPAADRLADVMAACGKTLVDVEAFVAAYGKRRAIHERLAQLPTLEAEREKLTAVCDRADRERDAALQRHAETVGLPVEKLGQIAALIEGTQGLDGELVSSCPYPTLTARHAELTEHIAKLEFEKFSNTTKQGSSSVRIVGEHNGRGPVEVPGPVEPGEARRLAREAGEARARLAEIEAELTAAKAELADLENRMKAL